MAVTFTPDPNTPGRVASLGSLLGLVGTLTFSGTYPTGGEPLDLTERFRRIGLGKVLWISDFRGYTAEYDNTNKKLLMWSSANVALIAGGYNAALTGSPVPIFVVGK